MRLRFDGQDRACLEAALSGAIFHEALEAVIRHLYWWQLEKNDEKAKAYEEVFRLVVQELSNRGIEVDWQVEGTVTTRDGSIVQKSVPLEAAAHPQASSAVQTPPNATASQDV